MGGRLPGEPMQCQRPFAAEALNIEGSEAARG